MSDWYRTDVSELKLRIPKADFPLKSEVIVGFEYPKLMYPEDEGEYNLSIQGDKVGDFFEWFEWNISQKDGNWNGGDGIHAVSNYDEWLNELVELVVKYKGTLVATSTGEEGHEEHTRIRDGVRKKVKIVEEEED